MIILITTTPTKTWKSIWRRMALRWSWAPAPCSGPCLKSGCLRRAEPISKKRLCQAKPTSMSTPAIYHSLKVDDQLLTGGQPTEEQLKSAEEEGFKTVINLATINPRYSLKDEAGLVQSLGMTYYHIPVEWEHPTESDFKAF